MLGDKVSGIVKLARTQHAGEVEVRPLKPENRAHRDKTGEPADPIGSGESRRPEALTPQTWPDETLIARMARGDTAAMSELVARKLSRLLSLARRMLGDATEAEDVAQETLLRTWKQAASWQPGAARIDTWMHRVALNLCYDRLRRRRKHVSSDDVELVDTRASAPMQIEQAQAAARLQDAIASLPERQRTAITLSYYQNMSNIDGAAVMGVSVEALESLLSRARRSLRTRLAEHDPPSSTLTTGRPS